MDTLYSLHRIAKENRIFAGLWYGPGKPDMTVFLKPMAQSLKMLRNEGNLKGCTIGLHAAILRISIHLHIGPYRYICFTTWSWVSRVPRCSALYNMWFTGKGTCTKLCAIQWLLWMLQLLTGRYIILYVSVVWCGVHLKVLCHIVRAATCLLSLRAVIA